MEKNMQTYLVLDCCEQFDFHTVPERTVFLELKLFMPIACSFAVCKRTTPSFTSYARTDVPNTICMTELGPSIIGMLIGTVQISDL
jgi:hypothetical protein